ncbi:cupin domain-containing protein [Sporosarcina cascadiensis]|uniref:cupin domain-containing protein n=1 Tax=Sporosarcina cascadiensis TaxID=2660747 RepID=UPI00129B48FD|nr:cupin domain-containing protein [Sporosarcina cascadiensis]
MKLIDTKYQLKDKEKHVGKVAGVEHADVLNIQLRKGEEVAEHDADREVFIIVKRGRVQFTVEGEPVEVTPDNMLHMAPLEKHSLYALEDSDVVVMKIAK